MKAFMSDVDGGPHYLDQDNPMGECFGRSAQAFAGEWAVNEARAILRETEPTRPGVKGFLAHPGCYVWEAGLFCAECMTPEPRAALAESLARFIALEVE